LPIAQRQRPSKPRATHEIFRLEKCAIAWRMTDMKKSATSQT
jgi:hypothetical protein